MINHRWKTSDGEEIPLSVMTTDHIKNCISYLKNKGFISPSTLSFYLTCEGPSGDMAQFVFEQECDAIFDASVHPWLDYFQEELKRRNEEKT